MAPPRPSKKPKPRKELAQAAAAASKWAFGTPGLSEKNLAAARRNYEYIQDRLRLTGGDLTDAEMGIGKRHKATRAAQAATKALLPPPSRYKPGDPEYSTSAGLNVKDIQRAAKAFTGPEKKRGPAILKELERQGFAKPETNQQAQAQVRQLVKRISASERVITNQARARAKQAAAPPPPDKGWAGPFGKGVDWVVPERVERAANWGETQAGGIAPDFLDAPMRNLKEIAADVAMAPAAIGETIYHDFRNNPFDDVDDEWLIPKLLKEGVVEWGTGIQRATPLPRDLRETLGHLKNGEFGKIKKEALADLAVMKEEWTKRPFTAGLNVYPAASMGMRIAEIPALVRSISKANPQMSRAAVLKAARKESYVPGYGELKGTWKGGIPRRLLTGKIVADGEVKGTFKAPARPPSRSTLGRKVFQGGYDKWSRSEGILGAGQIKGAGRFTETRRAARALQRRRTLEWEKLRVTALQQMDPIEKYIRGSKLPVVTKTRHLKVLAEHRARLAETFYGPQGPRGLPVEEMLGAVSEDLKGIAREGGMDIPTNKLEKIDKALARIDRGLDKQGPRVHFGQGRWAEAANMMREAGYANAQITDNLELAAAVARAWAKREPGRDPNDWIDSPEGRNVAGFVHGAPPPEKLKQSLFQTLYPDEQPGRIPSTDELRKTAFDGVDTSVFREHNIDDFLTKIPEYLQRGAKYRFWYENSGREILDFANGDKNLAARVAQVVAVMSASRNPRENINLALEAVREYQATGNITVTTAPQNAKAVAIMQGKAWEGRKTNRFYANMLEDIDPERYRAEFPEGGEVTNDIWMARLFGLKSDVPTPREYEAMAKIQQNIAAATGWKPKQIQAALWVPAKADAGRTVTGPGGVKIRAALTDDEAGIDFAQALQEESVTVPIEAAPGRRVPGQDYLRTYDDLDWEDKRAYTREKAEAVRQFLIDAQIFGRVEVEGLGIFENTTNPNFTVTIPTPVERLGTGRISPKTGEEIKTPVSWTTPTAKRHLTQVISIIGDAFNQDAMVWFRPIYRRDKPTAQNGMLLKTSRQLTDDETFHLHQELKKRIGDVPIIPAPDGGLYALNFSGAKNVAFHDEVGRVLAEIHEAGEAVSVEPVPFRFDGDYRTRSRYTKAPLPLGAAAARGGRPDVREAALGLRQRSEEIDGRYLGGPEPRAAPDAAAPAPRVLAQADPQEGIRGAVEFLDTDSGRQLVYMTDKANASTFAHEMFGHAAGEMKRELPDEFAKVEKRYGKAYENWDEAEHERFATEFERYLMTGKAPIPELQPVFQRAKRWMYTVYETIKALGPNRVPVETQRLFDRYFGKEPLDFTPPKTTPRRLGRNRISPGDSAAVGALVDETADLLMRGPEVLKSDQARRLRIAGNMKWLEQQVLPFVGGQDPELATRVHDLFDQFDEVKSGDSIFNPDERRLLHARGQALGMRAAEVDKMSTTLRSQPDEAVVQMAWDVKEALDDPDLTLEEVEAAVSDLTEVLKEARSRSRYGNESQRWLERQVKDLERAIDPKRRVNKEQRDDAINALREISGEMTGIYMDVFGEKLDPAAREALADTLRRRDNIIPTRLREMGLLDEGTGDGAYVPHLSVFDQLFNTLRGPVRLPAAGRNRKVLGMKVRAGRETFGKGANKLIRYQTGEVKVDPRALLSAYKNRLRFVETSMLRKELEQIAVDIPADSTGNPRIPEGWYIINTSSSAVPERLKRFQNASPEEIDDMLASGEDFDSMLSTDSGTIKMLEEYRDAWLRPSEGGLGDWAGDKGLQDAAARGGRDAGRKGLRRDTGRLHRLGAGPALHRWPRLHDLRPPHRLPRCQHRRQRDAAGPHQPHPRAARDHRVLLRPDVAAQEPLPPLRADQQPDG